MDKLDADKARFLFEVMKDERDFWFANRRSLEAKAGAIIAIMLTYVALVSGFVKLSDMNSGGPTHLLLAALWLALLWGLHLTLKVLSIGPAAWIPFTENVREAFNSAEYDIPQVCEAAINQFLEKWQPALLKQRSERAAKDLLAAYAVLHTTIFLGIGLLTRLCDCWLWASLAIVFSVILGLSVWFKTGRRIKNARRPKERQQ